MRANYWSATRAPRYSLLFAFPLLLAYEWLARVLSGDEGVRNGADVLLKSLFLVLGGRAGLTMFAVILLGSGLVLVVRDWRRSGPPRLAYFMGMLAEAILYALVFGTVTGALTGLLLHGPRGLYIVQGQALPFATRIMVSLGAGVYEELLFRVVIVSALQRLASRGFKWRPWAAGSFATFGGALIFSAFHYVGPLGDTLTLTSFVFRMVAGVLLSGLFLLRGYGITAWTHALYDVFLTVANG
ncbi:MAG TPA: CPBP family glutamic-type intramembrane protease [Gemmatimonadales bacterium]|nr:CPBP family glutamic-type intramembrane protease [Gemmatimonadales bacterium]